jgi:hypothetical protein
MKVAKRRVCTRNPPGSRKGVEGVPRALCVVQGQVEKHTGKGTKVSHLCKSLSIGRPGMNLLTDRPRLSHYRLVSARGSDEVKGHWRDIWQTQ